VYHVSAAVKVIEMEDI